MNAENYLTLFFAKYWGPRYLAHYSAEETMKKIFDFFLNVRLEYFIASYCTIAMILIMVFNVITRYALNFSFGWSDEIVRYLNLFAAFFGISAGMSQGVHIGITALVDLAIPKKAKKYFRLFAEIVTLVFCAVLVYFGSILVSKQISMGQVSPALFVPMYIMYGLVPAGMLLTSIQCLIRIFYRKEWKKDNVEPVA